MDDLVDEDEIKIEYYDILQSDPLCEKSNENTLVHTDVKDSILPSNTEKVWDPQSTIGVVATRGKSSDAVAMPVVVATAGSAATKSRSLMPPDASQRPGISGDLSNDGVISQYDPADLIRSPDITGCDTDKEQEDIEICMYAKPVNNLNWYRTIDESGKFVCQFCDLTYSTVQTIRQHVKTKHPDAAKTLKNIVKNNKRNPKIKCHICKKKFKEIRILKEHSKEHYSGNINQSCHVCFAGFNNEQEMTEHVYQKHQKLTNIKLHSCTLCGYQTRKLSHFKQHRNTHYIATKQMKCDSCDYATNYLPNLKIHQRIHTNYKPYLCTFGNCGYRCSAKSALRSHQLKHNPEENMLYCDKCVYRTVYKSSLKKHIESHKRNSL